MIDFKKIKDIYKSAPIQALKGLLGNGRTDGNDYVALNPRRADNHLGSFRVEISTGKFHDFSTGEKGSDIIDLAAFVYNCPLKKAAEQLSATFCFLASNSDKAQKTHKTPAKNEKIDVNHIWRNSSIRSHPYLLERRVSIGNARVNSYRGKNQIIVPLTDTIPTTEEEMVIKSIQFIDEKGNKSFPLPIKGLFHVASEYGKSTDVIVIAEGYATACSVAESTDFCVIAAMSAWNMSTVTETIRKQFPTAKIVIAADADNTGERVANNVLHEVKNVEVVYPSHGYNDFNDLYKALGAKAMNMVFSKEKFYE